MSIYGYDATTKKWGAVENNASNIATSNAQLTAEGNTGSIKTDPTSNSGYSYTSAAPAKIETPPVPVTVPTNTSDEAKNNLNNTQVSIQDQLKKFNDEAAAAIVARNIELDRQAIEQEAAIRNQWAPKQEALAQELGEAEKSSTALQFKLGRTGTNYASEESRKLETINAQRKTDLANSIEAYVQAAKAAIQNQKYSEARDMQAQANTKFTQLMQIQQNEREQQAADLDKVYKTAQVNKMQQEVVKENADTYAGGMLSINPTTGEVEMPSQEDLMSFSEQSGIPLASLLNSARTKVYELSKLSGEDRQRELNILKTQQEMIPQMFREYQYAQSNYGFKGSWQDYLKEQKTSDTSVPNSYKEWDLAGGQEGTGKSYAQFIAGNSTMDLKKQATFMQVSNKYQADSLMNAGVKGATAIKIADDVISNPSSAGNQLKILYTLVKNLDPDSAVREGELSLATQTQSYFDKYKTSLERLSKGKLLSDTATKELAEATKSLAQNWYDTAKRREGQYVSQAKVGGIEKEFSDYLGGFERPWDDTKNQTKNKINDYYLNNPEQQKYIDKMYDDGKTDEEIQEILFMEPLSKGLNDSTVQVTFGNSKATVSPIIADKLAMADKEFYEDTGKHLQINQSYRTREQQAKLYEELSKKGAQVAPPGKSFHEKGLAVDVTNWKEAEKYLNKQGLVNPMSNDKGHFSYGEFS